MGTARLSGDDGMQMLGQLGISFLTVLALSALVWWLYPRGGRLTEMHLEADFARLFPEEKFGDSLIAADYGSALIRSLAGKLYIAKAMGRDVTIRTVTAKNATLDATTLSLDQSDFTMPSCKLLFDAKTCSSAKLWLEDAGVLINA